MMSSASFTPPSSFIHINMPASGGSQLASPCKCCTDRHSLSANATDCVLHSPKHSQCKRELIANENYPTKCHSRCWTDHYKHPNKVEKQKEACRNSSEIREEQHVEKTVETQATQRVDNTQYSNKGKGSQDRTTKVCCQYVLQY